MATATATHSTRTHPPPTPDEDAPSSLESQERRPFSEKLWGRLIIPNDASTGASEVLLPPQRSLIPFDPSRQLATTSVQLTSRFKRSECDADRVLSSARERNFLSWIKLSSTLAVLSAALLIRFQFGSQVQLPEWEEKAQVPVR